MLAGDVFELGKVASRIGKENGQVRGKRQIFEVRHPDTLGNVVHIGRHALVKAACGADEVIRARDAQHLNQAQDFAPGGSLGRKIDEVEPNTDRFVRAHGFFAAAHDFQKQAEAPELIGAPDVAARVDRRAQKRSDEGSPRGVDFDGVEPDGGGPQGAVGELPHDAADLKARGGVIGPAGAVGDAPHA